MSTNSNDYELDDFQCAKLVDAADALLPEILAPYIKDLEAAREVMREFSSCSKCPDCYDLANKALVAQKVKL